MKKLFLLCLLLNSMVVLADSSDLLVGGTLTNKKTKSRMGILCGKKAKVKINDTEIEQCVAYEVVSLNGKGEVDYIKDLTVGYSHEPNGLKEIPDAKLGNKVYSEIYDYMGYYRNRNAADIFFYDLTALNIYGCTEKWAWCLLLPLTAVVDTAVSLAVNAPMVAFDGVILSIHGIDQLGKNAYRKSVRRKLMKDIVFMLNANKKGKNRKVDHERFEAFKSYL